MSTNTQRNELQLQLPSPGLEASGVHYCLVVTASMLCPQAIISALGEVAYKGILC